MKFVVKLVYQGKMTAHGSHFLRECPYPLEQRFIFKIMKYFMTILYCVDVVQGIVEKGL